VPPQFMEKLIDHRFSRATVGQFNDDARKTMAKIQELRARIRA